MIGAASVLLLLSAAHAHAQSPKFDGRLWTVGHQDRHAVQVLTEWGLPDQTIENWRELVTSQVFLKPVPVAALVERLRRSLAQGCPSLVRNVVQQDETTVVYEWRDSGGVGSEAQHEPGRITIEGQGLYRLAYAVNTKTSLPEAQRQTWLNILTHVPFAERSGPITPR
jgi:hypothetical protein